MRDSYRVVYRFRDPDAEIITVHHSARPLPPSLRVVLALGEVTQAPRCYEYISRLAPPGQQGLFMGYAFLPIGIGYLIGGRLAGTLPLRCGEVLHQPERMWYVLSGVGLLTTALMIVYNRVVKPEARARAPGGHAQ